MSLPKHVDDRRWRDLPLAECGEQVEEQVGRLAGAIERKITEAEHISARLTLPPQPVARPRMEMDLARRERRRERLGVDVGQHQHPTVFGVLDDGRRETVWAKADIHDRRVASLGRHAAVAGNGRTGSPAAAIAALTDAIE